MSKEHEIPRYPESAIVKDQRADRYTYHKPSEQGVTRHAMLSAGFIAIDELVDQIVPPGRERALVHTKLEEAKMWASAGVARDPVTR